MYRYFTELAYNGKNYHGWQVQPNAVSVQETVDKALSLVLKHKIETVGAGRTDTGVHARFFVAHFDFISHIEDTAGLTRKLNSFLPADICIKKIYSVPENSHARFSAVSRTYEYHISTIKNPFKTDFSWFFSKPLDPGLMNEAAHLLQNYSDFTSFSKVDTDTKTNLCRILLAEWSTEKNLLIFTIKADRFLRNMVRAIVGTLTDVGLHKISMGSFQKIIESRNRCNAGQSVPPQGLFLTEIAYPDEIYNIVNAT